MHTNHRAVTLVEDGNNSIDEEITVDPDTGEFTRELPMSGLGFEGWAPPKAELWDKLLGIRRRSTAQFLGLKDLGRLAYTRYSRFKRHGMPARGWATSSNILHGISTGVL